MSKSTIILKFKHEAGNWSHSRDKEVRLELDATDLSLPDLLEEFKGFIQAIGYPLNINDQIILQDADMPELTEEIITTYKKAGDNYELVENEEASPRSSDTYTGEAG